MKDKVSKSHYSLPKNTKFSICLKVKGVDSSQHWDLMDLSSPQAKWFLSHFSEEYYFVNKIGNYFLINVFLEKTGI